MIMDDTCLQLERYIADHNFSKIVILTDNTILNLYSEYFDFLPAVKKLIIKVPVSESAKKLSVCSQLWETLLAHGIDKDALWINFGGGSVSDVGGFVAATFKRGIHMVNYPTTLLGMIDAAVGGKNGINLEDVKNVVGCYYFPKSIFIDTELLKTLPYKELLNGFAELLKYGLICDKQLWTELSSLSFLNPQSISQEWIQRAIAMKTQIVEKDPYDAHERRILNVGHTIGHAIESLLMHSPSPITHGHAVAIGICYEALFSFIKGKLATDKLEEIWRVIRKFYEFPDFSPSDVMKMADFCMQDKKMTQGAISIPLLTDIGVAIPTEQITKEDVLFLFNEVKMNYLNL